MPQILLTSLLALAIQGSSPLRAVLDAPIAVFGHTVERVEIVMGRDPQKSRLEPIPNSQGPIPNGRLILDYAGVIITLRITTWRGASILAAVEVTDSDWLEKLGVPRTRQAVEAAFGRAAKASRTEMVYEDEDGSDIGPRVLRLQFDGDRLMRVHWTWPFD